MTALNWGIIGCGDVTEVKSGPAFGKIAHSSLGAVMRRDAAKAKDYAERHNVPKWYSDASELINDPGINAIYVATPPSSHEAYAIEAMKAGKPVYLEKPMATEAAACRRIAAFSRESGVKLSVAHYRRFLPAYVKIRELVESGAIGALRFASIQTLQPAQSAIVANSSVNWRIDPSVSGGGIFHDLAPHQLDIIRLLFGEVDQANGFATNQSGNSGADDLVSGRIEFKNGAVLSGLWCFNVPQASSRDHCEIVGSLGSINFPFFSGAEIFTNIQGQSELLRFENPAHIQQPMIEKVVEYFLGAGSNPCSGEDAIKVADIMDAFTKGRD
jgi:predicted dehydrogenase